MLKLAMAALILLAFAVPASADMDDMGEGVYIGKRTEAKPTPAEEQALTVPSVDMGDIERDEIYRKLMSAKGKKQRRKSLSEEARSLRPKSIEETASRVGFQEGYRYRYKQIEEVLRRRGQMLDTIFNFGPLLLEGGRVMPPVIAFADAFAEIKNADEMVQTGLTYRILAPARFITVQPSWRDYLLVPESALEVEKVHPSMLPLDAAEQAIWKDAVSDSWINGMEHADMMFQTGVNRMLVDLRGIIQYQMLARQGYIAMPQVSRGHLSVRVGDENLEFDQQTFRITEKARFQDVEREKKKKVRLDRPPIPERKPRQAAPARKPAPKPKAARQAPVNKPANTGAKLSLPEKGTGEVFVETPESSVNITAKSVSRPLSPEDLSEAILGRAERAAAMAESAVPERSEPEPEPEPDPEPAPEPEKPSRHGDFWGGAGKASGSDAGDAPRINRRADEAEAPAIERRGESSGGGEGSVPRKGFWD